MNTNDIKNLSALLAIAQKAIDVQIAKDAEREPREIFGRACNAYKHRNEVGFIERHSAEWDAMCEATSEEYAQVTKAERETFNARRRLQTAIRRYHQDGGVQ